MTKKVLLTILALGTFVSVSTLAVSKVFAEDSEYTHPVVARLAERFNLNEDDVEAVFDAVREERREEVQAEREDKLSQAVADGVITEEQKEAILAKKQEMRSEYQEKKEQHKQEMQAWFGEQGIDHEALREYVGFRGHKRFKGFRKLSS